MQTDHQNKSVDSIKPKELKRTHLRQFSYPTPRVQKAATEWAEDTLGPGKLEVSWGNLYWVYQPPVVTTKAKKATKAEAK